MECIYLTEKAASSEVTCVSQQRGREEACPLSHCRSLTPRAIHYMQLDKSTVADQTSTRAVNNPNIAQLLSCGLTEEEKLMSLLFLHLQTTITVNYSSRCRDFSQKDSNRQRVKESVSR
jgi:hypothetical protein